MDVTFANPWGLLALGGVLVVVVLHMLKVQPEPHAVSTLFLFEHASKRSEAGRRMDRLTTSIPFWLQILAVLLTTWLLVRPSFLLEDGRQRIVFVLDASASMSAFEKEARSALAEKSARLGGLAARTEWTLLASTGARLYRGEDRGALLDAAEQFEPRAGAHDPRDVLGLGLRLVDGQGAVVFVTDHVSPVPPGVKRLAVGRALGGVGFTGLTVDDAGGWTATIKNYGGAPATRSWRIVEKKDGEKQSITIGPNELRSIRGEMPQGVDELTLELDFDELSLDDTLAIVRPLQKPLRVGIATAVADSPIVKGLVRAVPRIETGGDDPHLTITSRKATLPIPPRPSIVWLDAPSKTVRRARLGAFATGHPLAADLEWRGLRYRPDKRFRAKAGDTVVLADGDGEPLVFLRDRALVIGFDPKWSNAARWPGFVIMLTRHLDDTRRRLVGFERRNVETGQKITLAVEGDVFVEGNKKTLPRQGGLATFTTPLAPGFTSIVDDSGKAVARYAARFADVREADLTKAAAVDELVETEAALGSLQRRDDPLAPLWALLLLGAMLGSFYFSQRSGRTS